MSNFLRFHSFMLESVEYDTVRKYQHGFITDMQRLLRSQKFIVRKDSPEYRKELQRDIDLLDQAISKGRPLKKGTILWRGLTDSKFAPKKNFVHTAFMSAAKNLNDTVYTFSTLGGTVMKLILDDSIKAIDVNKYLKATDIDGIEQEEVILPRGLRLEYISEENLGNREIRIYKIQNP
jgi:hypothetical protein